MIYWSALDKFNDSFVVLLFYLSAAIVTAGSDQLLKQSVGLLRILGDCVHPLALCVGNEFGICWSLLWRWL